MSPQKYAMVIDGVVDVISYSPDLDENGSVLSPWLSVPDEVFAGFIRNGDGSFSAPQTSNPQIEYPPLTARQLRLGLVLNGVDLQHVGEALDSIEDDQERTLAKIEWLHASQFSRSHPLVERVGAALGLSAEQINAMWLAASVL